jgi:hypothetical protein
VKLDEWARWYGAELDRLLTDALLNIWISPTPAGCVEGDKPLPGEETTMFKYHLGAIVVLSTSVPALLEQRRDVERERERTRFNDAVAGRAGSSSDRPVARLAAFMPIEQGTVIGQAAYALAEDQFLVRYKAGDGRQVEQWHVESAIAWYHEPADQDQDAEQETTGTLYTRLNNDFVARAAFDAGFRVAKGHDFVKLDAVHEAAILSAGWDEHVMRVTGHRPDRAFDGYSEGVSLADVKPGTYSTKFTTGKIVDDDRVETIDPASGPAKVQDGASFAAASAAAADAKPFFLERDKLHQILETAIDGAEHDGTPGIIEIRQTVGEQTVSVIVETSR